MINQSWTKADNTDQEHQDYINQKGKWFYQLMMMLTLAITALILGFIVVNFSSLYKNLRYSLSAKYFSKLMNLTDQSKIIAQTNNDNQDNDNIMIIPKIGLNVAINWDIPQENISDKLKYGLVHLNTSAKPNHTSGNVFITGDSSSPWWEKNPSGNAFSLLNRLQKGDRINITYQNKFYLYQVIAKLSVQSNQVELMQAANTQRLLTLMTDTPIGTNLKKLIVIAEMLSTNEQSLKKIQDEILKSNYFDPSIFIES